MEYIAKNDLCAEIDKHYRALGRELTQQEIIGVIDSMAQSKKCSTDCDWPHCGLPECRQKEINAEQAFKKYAIENLYPFMPKGDSAVWDMPEFKRQIAACQKAFITAYKII